MDSTPTLATAPLRSTSLRSPSLRRAVAKVAGDGRPLIFLSNMLIILLALHSNSDYEECLSYVGTEGAPFYWPAMIALQHDTRAMDIHCFLTYRLRNGLKRPVVLHAKVLHALFGQDIRGLKQFWHKFKKSLLAAHEWYPQAQIEMKNDCIILKDSPPLIPYRKVPRLGQSE